MVRRFFPFRLRVLAALGVFGALVMVALLPPAHASFEFRKKGRKKSYSSRPFSGAESTAVLCAIEEIGNMALSDPNARTGDVLSQIYTCLRIQLQFGGLCALVGGKNKSLGATMTEKPPKCGWFGDKIVIKETILSKSEPAFSQLIGILVHEGIHALEWSDSAFAPPDSTFDTPGTDEWASYGWETYVYCRRLEEGGLSGADSTEIVGRKDYTHWRAMQECNPSLDPDERRERIKECSLEDASEAAPGESYRQRIGDSSRIRVGDASSFYEIQTPFVRTFGFDVEADLLGGDVLVVIGEDAMGSGGVVMYYDNTLDGLADPSTETLLGSVTNPISLDFRPADGVMPAQIFVLDGASGNVLTAVGDANGRLMSLNPVPFASAGAYPYLLDMVSVEAGEATPVAGVSCYVSDVEDDSDKLGAEYEAHRFIDLDVNGVADSDQVVGWADDVETYIPTIVNDPQAGDASVETAGVSGHTIKIYATDAGATVLGELLASVVISPGDHVSTITVSLSRALVAGEHVVPVDDTTGERETAGTLVHSPRPEITGMSRSVYSPGQELVIFGRNFGPPATVLLSGAPLTVTSNTATTITASPGGIFSVPKRPNNFHVVRVVAGGDTSTIFGVYVGTDCNNNGVDDPVDIEIGSSLDLNLDGIPDECSATFVPKTPPAVVTRLEQNYPNPFNPATVIRYHLGRGGRVDITIYNIQGQRIKTLVAGHRDRGPHRVTWDGRDERGAEVASGVYFYKMTAGSFRQSRKLVVLR